MVRIYLNIAEYDNNGEDINWKIKTLMTVATV